MIEHIKAKLLEDPEKIRELLERYDFHKVKINTNYITCARSEAGDSSPKSIVIRLRQNDALLVKDYPKNTVCDIFNYAIKEKHISYKQAITEARNILGIERGWCPESRSKAPFGNFYGKIKRRDKQELKIYDENILDEYMSCGNTLFMQDGISLETQRKFNIRFSIKDQAVVIPIYSETGDLIAVKARINKVPEGDEQKYYFLYSGAMSQTLYGYCQNYEYLESAEEVVIVESEKSVMQCSTFGVHNILALGSSSLSKKQAQLILSLNPKRVILAHDKSIEPIVILRNATMLRVFGKLKEFDVLYVDMEDDDRIPSKASPSDMGEEMYQEIMRDKVISYNEVDFKKKHDMEEEKHEN